MKTRIIFILLTLTSLSCFADEEAEFEYLDISSWKWSLESELSYYNNTSTLLSVRNSMAEPKENKKKGVWNSEVTWMNLQSLPKDRSYTITFNVVNKNDEHDYKYKVYSKQSNGQMKEEWHKGDVYWGIVFKMANDTEYTIHYDNEKNSNNSYTYTSIWDSDSRQWQPNADIHKRTVKIEYDGKSIIKIYTGYGSTLVKTVSNTKGIQWIGIKVGTAAHIEISNLSIYCQTTYGVAVSYMREARELIQKEDYNSAIIKMDYVIDNIGYKSADAYLFRASTYFLLNNNSRVIDDCTKAISLKRDFEEAYALRGASKLMMEDETGIDDLKRGGPDAIAWLKENGLYESESSTITKQNQYKPRPSTNILKKDPNFKLE